MRLLAFFAVAAGVLTVSLAGCATPEELAAVERKRQERQAQTGTNIIRPDSSGMRTATVTDKDAQDALLNDLRNAPVQPVQSLGQQGPGR
jgi:hypothetical protein